MINNMNVETALDETASVAPVVIVDAAQPAKGPAPLIGIDFGTQRLVVAVAAPGSEALVALPRCIGNNLSNDQTPSIISFKDNERTMGEDALNQFVSAPRATVSQLKRLLGVPFGDARLQADLQRLPFRIVAGPEGSALIELGHGGESLQFRPEQLAAMLLEKVASFVALATGSDQPPTAVIAVPAGWNEAQRAAMVDAARIAGLSLAALVSEGTAAALSYGFAKTAAVRAAARDAASSPAGAKAQPAAPTAAPLEELVLFVELGHGCFSCQLVEFRGDSMTVLASVSDETLGARDIDYALLDHAAAEFQRASKADIRTHAKALCRVIKAANKAKEILSTIPETDLTVEALIEDRDLRMRVSRTLLETLGAPLLDRIEAHLRSVLDRAGVSMEAVTFVEVIGGGLRIPCVQQRVRQVVGPKELSFHLDSAHCVATGAAVKAVLLQHELQQKQEQQQQQEKQQPQDEQPTQEQQQAQPPAAGPVYSVIDAAFEAVPTAPRMPDPDVAAAAASNAALRAADEQLAATRHGRNELETYLYASRDRLTSPAYAGLTLPQEASAVETELRAAEDWLHGDGQAATLPELLARHSQLTDAVSAAAPRLAARLQEEAAERAQAAAAEAALRAAQADSPDESPARERAEPRTKNEKIDAAKKRKHQGNTLFKDLDYEGAASRYSQAVAYVSSLFDLSVDQKREVDEICLSCYLNLSMCNLRLNRHERARDNAADALKLEPNNVKALFRRGQACYYLREFEQAKTDLTAAAKLDPKNQDVRRTLATVQERLKESLDKQKAVYGKMFG
eukprot:TRINITY_DN3811_c0_g1_i1.p1 TRINITY_DN3811_c0_g1~~TRINITY_DN3811_c0_g1_i1.p1  ORF type:complete len:797 (+),score=327.93 TRINITY_DN3811_c0_g1_i1:77-2467(+)